MKWKTTTAIAAIILFVGAVIGTVSSCKKSNKSATGPTFYDSLGGTTLVTDPANFGQTVEQGYLAIRTIVDTALLIIAADDSINAYFNLVLQEDSTGNESPYDSLKVNMANFLAVAAGAKDYSYTGPGLIAAHNPDSNGNISMKVTSAAFNRFAYDLGQSAYNYYHLSDQLISQFGTLLYRYESQVVQP
jgi:hypothetical protein